MDCEKLDQHVIDALYGELDELTQAALERHAEGCSRCGPVYAGLKATRAVAILPLEEPPADLEDRILAAAALHIEAKAPPPASRRGRLVRLLAWPRLAAAAVFVLVIGSSLALLQTKSGAGRSAAPAIAAESSPAATAAAQAAPPSYRASEPSPMANIGGEPPAASASAAATAVTALPVASAAVPAAQSKAAAGRVAANEAEKASPSAKAPPPPPAAKPQNQSFGGTNPRAPAAPLYNDAFK